MVFVFPAADAQSQPFQFYNLTKKQIAWSAILTRLSVSLSLFHLVFSVFISRMINKDFMSEF